MKVSVLFLLWLCFDLTPTNSCKISLCRRVAVPFLCSNSNAAILFGKCSAPNNSVETMSWRSFVGKQFDLFKRLLLDSKHASLSMPQWNGTSSICTIWDKVKYKLRKKNQPPSIGAKYLKPLGRQGNLVGRWSTNLSSWFSSTYRYSVEESQQVVVHSFKSIMACPKLLNMKLLMYESPIIEKILQTSKDTSKKLKTLTTNYSFKVMNVFHEFEWQVNTALQQSGTLFKSSVKQLNAIAVGQFNVIRRVKWDYSQKLSTLLHLSTRASRSMLIYDLSRYLPYLPSFLSRGYVSWDKPTGTLTPGCSRPCSLSLTAEAAELGQRLQTLMKCHVPIQIHENKVQQQSNSKIQFPDHENGSHGSNPSENRTLSDERFSPALSDQQIEDLLRLQIYLASLLVDWDSGPWMMGKSTLLGSVRHADVIPWTSQLHQVVNMGQWVSLLALLTDGGRKFESGGYLIPASIKDDLLEAYNSLSKSCVDALPMRDHLGVSIVPNEGSYLGHFEFRVVPKRPTPKSQSSSNTIRRVQSLFRDLLTWSVQLIQRYSSQHSSTRWTPSITIHPFLHSSNGMVYDVSSNLQLPVQTVYPLHPRPLGPILLPSPFSPQNVIHSTFRQSALEICYRRLTTSDNSPADSALARSADLNQFYSFVKERSGQKRQRTVLNNKEATGACGEGPRTLEDVNALDATAFEKYRAIIEVFYPGVVERTTESSFMMSGLQDVRVRTESLFVKLRHSLQDMLNSWKWTMSGSDKIRREVYVEQPWVYTESITVRDTIVGKVLIMGGEYH